jgi:hypothetical protein
VPLRRPHRTRHRFCTNCQRADNRRRNDKRRDSGRGTQAWQQLREACFTRDGWICKRCHRVGTARDLHAHLAPALGGNHWNATLGDLVTLCHSCHGTVDAPRAHNARNQPTPPRDVIGINLA